MAVALLTIGLAVWAGATFLIDSWPPVEDPQA
jgi:hypothetical protein